MGERENEQSPDEPDLTDAEISEGEDIAVPSGDVTKAIMEALDDVADRDDDQESGDGRQSS